jgi:hypothetical protein
MNKFLLSRSEWCARGRVVVVDNSQAEDVVNFWEENVRGAKHVFTEDQTVPADVNQEQVQAA